MFIVADIPHGEIFASMINPFMDIDFYTLYSFMHYISIFNRSGFYVYHSF